MYWRLNRIQYPIYNLGPGKRIGIWVQGCSLKCKGCVSKSLQSRNTGKNIDIEYLANSILEIQDNFQGVTITGGEPFEQYNELLVFCLYIKKNSNLDIYVFSGYTLEELLENHSDRKFLDCIDYLLDGRYIRKQHDNNNVRGSTNQLLYCFLDGKAELQNNFFITSKWSINLSDVNDIYMSGIPKEGELQKISSELSKLGRERRFT